MSVVSIEPNDPLIADVMAKARELLSLCEPVARTTAPAGLGSNPIVVGAMAYSTALQSLLCSYTANNAGVSMQGAEIAMAELLSTYIAGHYECPGARIAAGTRIAAEALRMAKNIPYDGHADDLATAVPAGRA